MKTIENQTSRAAAYIKFFKLAIIANILYCLLYLGWIGAIAAIPGTLALLILIHAEGKRQRYGNIYLSESGFIIERYSTEEVPWASIDSISRHVTPYLSNSTLVFHLAKEHFPPKGYPTSKHYFGENIICANIMFYQTSPLDIHKSFLEYHQASSSNNRSTTVSAATY